MKQISYSYWGRIRTKSEPVFTDKELADGFELVWMTLDQPIMTLSQDQPQNLEGLLIQERDLCILQKA